MIVSLVDGRVRIRDEAFKTHSVTSSLKSRLTSAKGVEGVTANPRAGSILIIYDSAATSIQNIIDAVKGYINISATKKPLDKRKVKSVSIRRIINIGMFASLFMSLVGMATGFMKLHLIAGLMFVGFLGIHLAG